MRRLPLLIAALALVAVACGDDDSGEPTMAVATTAAAPPTTPVTAPPETSEPTTTVPQIATELSAGWEVVPLGRGVKPDLALDGGGLPGVTWLIEAMQGFIAYADAPNDWVPEEVATGYFYGPITLAYGADGEPIIAYHDHQAPDFDPELGDLTVAFRGPGLWDISTAHDDGHDGWDSAVAVGPDGTVHAAGVDPIQFQREDGIEHYELVDGDWVVDAIGVRLVEYSWNVSLEVTPEGSPVMSYHDTTNLDLGYAERIGGEWSLTAVDEEGDVGAFSSLALDEAGRPHIAYIAFHGDESDVVVKYATRTDGEWRIEEVISLSDVEFGHFGARRITSIAIGPAGDPAIATGDRGGVWLSTRSPDGSWASEQVAAAGANPLGQLVSLAVDASGTPHLAFSEITSAPGADLDGTVLYVSRRP